MRSVSGMGDQEEGYLEDIEGCMKEMEEKIIHDVLDEFVFTKRACKW